MLGTLEALEKEIDRGRRSREEPRGEKRGALLSQRAADFQDRAGDRRTSKRRRRRSPSDSRSGDSSDRDFRGGRGGASSEAASVARRAPGQLLEDCLKKMRKYLTTQQGSGGGADPLAPVVTSYLTSVLVPAAGSQLSLRNSGELRHLAEALDCLLVGNVVGAADVLAQRFRSVETAHFDGSWAMAKHLEVVGDAKVSSISVRDRQRIARLAKEEAKAGNATG
jgi:hypothetical protein